MLIDASELAGFPLTLDTNSLMVTSAAGFKIDQQARLMRQMESVLLEPQARPPDDPVYWTCRVYDGGASEPRLSAAQLAFSCVLVPPDCMGREFAKTQGHYHPAMPGTGMSYPEVYTHYVGELYLLMQRREGGQAGRLNDCVLIEMRPGVSVMVPPGYAHILINPSDRPALMAGLYSPEFAADYQPMRELAGAAYFLVNEGGQETTVANERYELAPPLVRLTDVSATRFAPPDNSQPLWTSFVNDPERYRMLSDGEAARQYFPLEDQQR